MAIVRKIFRHSSSPALALPAEVREHLHVRLGDYVAWRLLDDGEVRLVSLEEAFRAGYFRRSDSPGVFVSPGQSAAPLRRGG